VRQDTGLFSTHFPESWRIRRALGKIRTPTARKQLSEPWETRIGPYFAAIQELPPLDRCACFAHMSQGMFETAKMLVVGAKSRLSQNRSLVRRGPRNSRNGLDLATAVLNRHVINQNTIKRQIARLIGQRLWPPRRLPDGPAPRPDPNQARDYHRPDGNPGQTRRHAEFRPVRNGPIGKR
jgi:hypothetical protein